MRLSTSLFLAQTIVQILVVAIPPRLVGGFALLYAKYVVGGDTSGLVVVKVAVYVIVFVEDGLRLGDVVYGVEDDIVRRMTDADGGVVLFAEGEIGEIVHEALEHAAGGCSAVGSGGDA